MLIVIAVTFGVSMGLSSSMLMTCNGSGVVAVAIFCHGCFWVLVVAAGFPVCGVLGPFCIK